MDDQIPFHPHVQAVLAAIRQLSPDARRRLQRRLQPAVCWCRMSCSPTRTACGSPALGEAAARRQRAGAGRGPALPRKTCVTNHPHAARRAFRGQPASRHG
ncbi:MAG: hypothetical protein R2838_18665 [Caldilineaceae bacterium]